MALSRRSFFGAAFAAVGAAMLPGSWMPEVLKAPAVLPPDPKPDPETCKYQWAYYREPVILYYTEGDPGLDIASKAAKAKARMRDRMLDDLLLSTKS